MIANLILKLIMMLCLIVMAVLATVALIPEKVIYQDRNIEVPAQCLLDCTQEGNAINCYLPNNKTLEINKVIYYDTRIR